MKTSANLTFELIMPLPRVAKGPERNGGRLAVSAMGTIERMVRSHPLPVGMSISLIEQRIIAEV